MTPADPPRKSDSGGSGPDGSGPGGTIVHFGVGNFHRAHQAWHLSKMNARAGCDWKILGVSPRRSDVRNLLRPRGWRYRLLIEDADGAEWAELGIHSGVLVAPENPEAVVAAVADPRAALMTFTVTENGYAAAESSAPPAGIFHLIARGLARRRDEKNPGATFISCDNLPENGAVLREKILAAAEAIPANPAEWIARECAFPAAMADRIVPRPDESPRARLRDEFAADDPAAVRTERFSQWVVEDRFAAARPPLESGGVEVAADIRPAQAAKLAMLNGAHSLLACAGLLRGMAFVHEAAAHPGIAARVGRLWDEAAEMLDPPADYRVRLAARFRNAALAHRLAQIAADSSRKIPARWTPMLRARRAAGLASPALENAAAQWTALMMKTAGKGIRPDDPQAELLIAAARSGPKALLALDSVFGDFFAAQPRLMEKISREAIRLAESEKR